MTGPRDGEQQPGSVRADTRLEARYRRLLALYPARYRQVHEEEMLAVLMTAARPGQRKPALAEALDLVAGAVRVRCQPASKGEPAWRQVLAMAAAAASAGLVAGLAFAALNPPPHISTESVQISSEGGPRGAHAQAAAATTPAVLERAARSIGPAISPQALQHELQVTLVTDQVLTFTVRAATARQAVRAVAAVARSFLIEVNSRATSPRHQANVLDPATIISGTSWLAELSAAGGTGALCGALIGTIAGLAASRTPRRLRLT